MDLNVKNDVTSSGTHFVQDYSLNSCIYSTQLILEDVFIHFLVYFAFDFIYNIYFIFYNIYIYFSLHSNNLLTLMIERTMFFFFN